MPQNPCGRTGVSGLGVLPRWGPNHALLCAIVRRKLHTEGGQWRQVESHERPVLEVFLQRNSNYRAAGKSEKPEENYSPQEYIFPMSFYESVAEFSFRDT